MSLIPAGSGKVNVQDLMLSKYVDSSSPKMILGCCNGTHYDNDRYRYSGIYFRPPYGAYGVSYYDADYCYTPTAEQVATAQEQVEDYLLAVKKQRKNAATHRYISVETLRPTKKQREDYTKKRSEKELRSKW